MEGSRSDACNGCAEIRDVLLGSDIPDGNDVFSYILGCSTLSETAGKWRLIGIPYNHNDPGGDCDLEEGGGGMPMYTPFTSINNGVQKKT